MNNNFHSNTNGQATCNECFRYALVGDTTVNHTRSCKNRHLQPGTPEVAAVDTTEAATVCVAGNTYPLRDQIALLGGKWNKSVKAWFVAPSAVEAVKALGLTVAGPGTDIFGRPDRENSDY